jgi:hypothetical protein
MRKLVAILLSALTLLVSMPASAQAQISDLRVEYQFGEQIHFQATLESDAPVESAFLFVGEKDGTHTYVEPVSAKSVGEGKYELECSFDLVENPLRAFTTVEYRFDVQPAGGEMISSSLETFEYTDNRFEWQQLEEKPFRVYWYEGGLAFAQKVLDTAQAGLKNAQNMAMLSTPEMVRIYVYPNSADMQETISLASRDSAAGHADPDLGVMVVSLPAGPDQQLLMEQRLPHELMHVLLYQLTGPGYASLPAWLNEGLASAGEMFSNPEYQSWLEHAYHNGGLLPISSLCKTFPKDAPSALLAYAESQSFVSYLYNTFGKNGLQSLVAQYSNQVDCEKGAVSALGFSLVELEEGWRADRFGENLTRQAIINLLPWMVLLAAILIGPILLVLTYLRKRPVGKAKDKG